MLFDNKIWIGNTEKETGAEKVYIYPKMSNRHGFIAGATGTGKTVTLKVLAESFSDFGVPVFLADVKGDLAGICENGKDSEDMQKRIQRFGLNEAGFSYKAYPVNFWDVYGEMGLPLRTTISEMGPILLGKILGLNDTQSSVLKVIFKIADDEGLLLIDTKDLRAMLTYISENAKEYSAEYGNMAPQSLAAIIRSVIALESEGGDLFFGEPALDIRDWITTSYDGRGFINVLDCQKLINNPTMYSAFLLWMLSELHETLPEVGDMEKPRMVFFFDEAHILFDNASKELLEKIEQIVKLIRSKGVSIFFITQNPKDIPDGVLSQLGTKIEHALRAYTPVEMKGAKIAAQSFRPNPEFDTLDAMMNLGIGEALVSVLDEEGIPTVVQKTKILPPQSKMGAIELDTRNRIKESGNLFIKYKDSVDPDSAYEFLQRKSVADAENLAKAKEDAELAKQEALAEKEREKAELAEQKAREKEEQNRIKELERQIQAEQKAREKEEQARLKALEKEALAMQRAREKEEEKRRKAAMSAAKSVGNSVAGTIGREVGKNMGSAVGGSFGKKLGGNVGASLGRGIIGTLFSK